MKPDQAKVQALQDLPRPKNQEQMQSSLGLINYIHPFLLGLAFKTTFLCKKITQWDWNPFTDKAFLNLKQWICNTPLKTTLAYYDKTKQAVIQTNACEYSINASLIQNCRLIAFASKTLTNVKTRYTNIE